MLYHDDGENPLALEEKEYEIIHFSSSLEPKTLNIKVEKEEGGEATDKIQLIEVIIENLEKPVDVVRVNTLRFTAQNYMHNGKLVIPVRFDVNNITTIKLEFL
jgi:oligosaccharide 4-alpha-D-glucosyltransferase